MAMDIVGLKIEELKIVRFNAREGTMDFELFFNDGAGRKYIEKKMPLGDSNTTADELLHGVRLAIARMHYKYSTEKKVLSNYMNIVIEDEGVVMKRMAMFIDKSFNIALSLKSLTTSDGYLQMLNSVSNVSLKFP